MLHFIELYVIIQFECLENVLLINNIRIILSVQLDIRSNRNLLHNNKIREIFATKSNANILIQDTSVIVMNIFFRSVLYSQHLLFNSNVWNLKTRLL